MKIGDYINNDQGDLLYQEDATMLTNDSVGVELELENIQYNYSKSGGEKPRPERFMADKVPPTLGSHWKVIKDGSLRKGTEFIFSSPFNGANISFALSKMQNFIDKFSYGNKPIKVSDRCSVHVHLDVRDIDNNQLSNLILIYLMVERVLFMIIEKDRVKNNYCRPLTDSSFKYTISKIIREENKDSIDYLIRAIISECDKYSALNLLPVSTYGSIEFRHHEGTKDMEKVRQWINVILAVKRASTISIYEYLEYYKEHGAIPLVNRIFDGTVLASDAFISGKETAIEDAIMSGVFDTREVINMQSLEAITNNRNKSRVRPVNTLFYQFKKVNGIEV